jgi:hypothetical protein
MSAEKDTYTCVCACVRVCARVYVFTGTKVRTTYIHIHNILICMYVYVRKRVRNYVRKCPQVADINNTVLVRGSESAPAARALVWCSIRNNSAVPGWFPGAEVVRQILLPAGRDLVRLPWHLVHGGRAARAREGSGRPSGNVEKKCNSSKINDLRVLPGP